MSLPKAVAHPRPRWTSFARTALVVVICVVTTHQLTRVMCAVEELADLGEPDYGYVAAAIESQNMEISRLRGEIRARTTVVAPTTVATWVAADTTIVDLRRDQLTRLLTRSHFTRGARIVPRLTSGKTTGFKIFAIRPSSSFAKLGLENGDTLKTINDVELATYEAALDAYTKLGSADFCDIRLERKGKPHRIVVVAH